VLSPVGALEVGKDIAGQILTHNIHSRHKSNVYVRILQMFIYVNQLTHVSFPKNSGRTFYDSSQPAAYIYVRNQSNCNSKTISGEDLRVCTLFNGQDDY
jgi:hypothetical protein